MTGILTVALLGAPVAVFFYLACRTLCQRRARALNLTGDANVFVDQKLPLKISPTAADGSPAPVTDVVWAVASGSLTASINTITPDLLNAELICDEPADLEVTVTAKAADGTELVERATVRVEARPPIAVALNLALGEPQPRG